MPNPPAPIPPSPALGAIFRQEIDSADRVFNRSLVSAGLHPVPVPDGTQTDLIREIRLLREALERRERSELMAEFSLLTARWRGKRGT